MTLEQQLKEVTASLDGDPRKELELYNLVKKLAKTIVVNNYEGQFEAADLDLIIHDVTQDAARRALASKVIFGWNKYVAAMAQNKIYDLLRDKYSHHNPILIDDLDKLTGIVRSREYENAQLSGPEMMVEFEEQIEICLKEIGDLLKEIPYVEPKKSMIREEILKSAYGKPISSELSARDTGIVSVYTVRVNKLLRKRAGDLTLEDVL